MTLNQLVVELEQLRIAYGGQIEVRVLNTESATSRDAISDGPIQSISYHAPFIDRAVPPHYLLLRG